jgi:hypothetical protein
MPFVSATGISLAPGFSPVGVGRADHSRFNGFRAAFKAAEAAAIFGRRGNTGLKPGANESKSAATILKTRSRQNHDAKKMLKSVDAWPAGVIKHLEGAGKGPQTTHKNRRKKVIKVVDAR